MRSRPSSVIALSFLSLVALATTITACMTTSSATPASTTTTDGGTGNNADASDGGTVGASALSCSLVIGCIGNCPDSDAACPDACVGAATPDGKEKVTALATCVDAEKCTDVSCIETKCAPSLAACFSTASTSTGGKPIDGTPPLGNVPADLVGSWRHSRYGFTDNLDLGADGIGHWGKVGNVDWQGFCYTNSSDEVGNAVVTADQITIYATEVNNIHKPCNGALKTTSGAPIVRELFYKRKDATTLIVVDLLCADQHAGDQKAVDSGCTYTLTKTQ
jgi:hypothetical protein